MNCMPSLRTCTLLLPAHIWMCFGQAPAPYKYRVCILSDNCHSSPLLCNKWAAHWADYVGTCKQQPTAVRSKQNSVTSCSQHSMEGQNTYISCCLYPTLLSTCPPNMRSLINFQLGNYVCWSDLHSLSDGKQSMNGGMIWSDDEMHKKSGPTLLCPPDCP
jgi:hypothetical protein